MTRFIEERLESLEKNVADHERAIGDNSGKESLAETADRHERLIRDDLNQLAGVTSEYGELQLRQAQDDSARRSEIAAIAWQLASLAGKFERHKARSTQLSNGLKSYDKRIAALEEALPNYRANLSTYDSVAFDHRIAALEAAVAERRTANEDRINGFERRISILEYRDDDPLRRPPGVYSGTGDDATDDTPDDPVSRDIDSLVDQTAIAVRDFLASQHESLIEAGISPYEAANRVHLHRHELLTRVHELTELK